MKTKLVTDTSFWKDMHAGDILFLPFELDYEWVVPNLVTLELQKHLGNFSRTLFSRGLIEEDLAGELVEEIDKMKGSLITAKRKFRNISINDLSSFVLARSIHSTLITSDGSLREFAEKKHLDVHGTLWILDELVESAKILLPTHGAEAIKNMLKRGRRLPLDECEKRVKKWSR